MSILLGSGKSLESLATQAKLLSLRPTARDEKVMKFFIYYKSPKKRLACELARRGAPS